MANSQQISQARWIVANSHFFRVETMQSLHNLCTNCVEKRLKTISECVFWVWKESFLTVQDNAIVAHQTRRASMPDKRAFLARKYLPCQTTEASVPSDRECTHEWHSNKWFYNKNYIKYLTRAVLPSSVPLLPFLPKPRDCWYQNRGAPST